MMSKADSEVDKKLLEILNADFMAHNNRTPKTARFIAIKKLINQEKQAVKAEVLTSVRDSLMEGISSVEKEFVNIRMSKDLAIQLLGEQKLEERLKELRRL